MTSEPAPAVVAICTVIPLRLRLWYGRYRIGTPAIMASRPPQKGLERRQLRNPVRARLNGLPASGQDWAVALDTMQLLDGIYEVEERDGAAGVGEGRPRPGGPSCDGPSDYCAAAFGSSTEPVFGSS
ncbi:hypothetical protein GCM10020229_74650 [Kitasatospora albolonga]